MVLAPFVQESSDMYYILGYNEYGHVIMLRSRPFQTLETAEWYMKSVYSGFRPFVVKTVAK